MYFAANAMTKNNKKKTSLLCNQFYFEVETRDDAAPKLSKKEA